MIDPSTLYPLSPDADYDIIRRAIAFISEQWRNQPSIERIADHVGLSETDLHHVFRRWCGLTPKAFVQALTLDQARLMLRNSASVLETSLELGLSGPARLHDLFVTHEAMTPGDYKTGGAGLLIRYGFHPSQFGMALVLITDRGLCGLAFCDSGEEAACLADMTKRWPFATYAEDKVATAPFVGQMVTPCESRPLRLVLIGTDFEVSVWQTLLRIPMGHATTYGDIASHLGRPKASRAVGAAVGKNPISFVVPCHRVLGKSGALTGYHWGLTRKRAMLGWEFAKTHDGSAPAQDTFL